MHRIKMDMLKGLQIALFVWAAILGLAAAGKLHQFFKAVKSENQGHDGR